MGRGFARGRAGVRSLAAAGVLIALVAGCTNSGSSTSAQGPDGGGGAAASPSSAAPTTEPAAAPARLAISPKNGATGLSVAAPVTVKVTGGTVSAVALRNGDGEAVKGAYNADRTVWTSAEALGYDKTYSVSATAANADGKTVKATSAFSTVQPRTLTLPYLYPGNGGGPKTVGVGQPVQVRFDEPISDKAAAEKALTVTTSPHVDGAWHWFSDQVAHWRPKTYWAPGTKVTVKAAVYGVHVGDDVYGQEDVSSSFTIGRSKIFTINDKTHLGTVRINGKIVKDGIPVSMGRGGSYKVDNQTIFFTTQSGPHIVAEKYPVKRMTSASYGLPKDTPLGYDELIKLAIRISPDGEFLHSAPWSVWAQGKQNTSHGCVNLSPANAQWFYDNFSTGDVVDIKGTGVDLPFAPGYNEWNVSWAKWTAGSATR
ncbi:MAG TPA: Ig-like domain-containing protein [Mycobacteriales bacterium]|nr:Ig-like domain-containing protein [Mycobacteriales bacterium]